ncbi:DNA-binding response regulator [Bacillus solimangrovi]|uniref:DNA-binding response regulator n=2 Tax=Bacillus solimangrovi TaxID=1305675 RepID=A0A1E5LFL1_9BACI|nr:DNA-binding response regulator [Bacillus solimangrovi]
MRDLVTLYLEPHHYTCISFASGEEVLQYLEKGDADLLILDIMMPGMNGNEVAREVRLFSNIPIIMLTAKDTSQDMVTSLKNGADDYITKPFDEDVLLARIEALLRRTNNVEKLEIKGLCWDEKHHILTYHQDEINVTPKEFAMLGLLMKNPKVVFEREKLLDRIWGYDAETDGRTIDSHIRNLREKCRKSGFPIDDHLKTVWGIGYKWIL